MNLIGRLFGYVDLVTAEFPDDPGAMKTFREAGRLSSAGNTKGAIGVLAQAVEKWPACAYLWLGLAMSHRHAGDLLGARADAAVALGLAPDDPIMFRTLGWILHGEGNAEAAEAALEVGWEKFEQLLRRPAPGYKEMYFRHGRGTIAEDSEGKTTV